MLGLALYILIAPLAAFTTVIFFGRKLPRGGDFISLFAIWSGLAGSLYLFFTQMLGHYDPNFALSYRFDWVTWGSYKLNIGIAIDNMAMMMLVVVTLVSSLAHLFQRWLHERRPQIPPFLCLPQFLQLLNDRTCPC